MKRSQFLFHTLLLFPVVSFLKSCFSSPQSNGDGKVIESGLDITYKLLIESISNNHGHNKIDLTVENVQSDRAGAYILSGGGHSHFVQISSENLKQLRNNSSTKIYVTDYHVHTIDLSYIGIKENKQIS